MDEIVLLNRIISNDRIQPYLNRHNYMLNKAIRHYQSNILISESFYPLLALLEVGLRNSMDYQLTKLFNDRNWYENRNFFHIASRFQIERISDAKATIQSERKEVTPGRIIAELSFGFWTSLLDTRFEMSLWKSLRLAFPNCPKRIRQRKTMSTRFNAIRKLRNRVFHHEAISWNLTVLESYKNELLEGIEWLDGDLLIWAAELNHVSETIEKYRSAIE